MTDKMSGPKSTRVMSSSESNLAVNYRRQATNLPSLQQQKEILKDFGAKTKHRQIQLGRLSTEEVRRRAEATRLPEKDPYKARLITVLQPTDLSRKVKHNNEPVKEKKIKEESITSSEDIQKKARELEEAKRRIKAKIEAKKNIKSRGGSRFDIKEEAEIKKEAGTIKSRKRPFKEEDVSSLSHSNGSMRIPTRFDELGNPIDQFGKKMAFLQPEKTIKINQREGPRAIFKRNYNMFNDEKMETQKEALTKAAQIKAEEIKKEEEDGESLKAKVLRSNAIPETSQFYDPRLKEKKNGPERVKRSFFDFHEQGKFIKQGKQMRHQAHLNVLQTKIEAMAKKTGIQQASKLATVAHSAVKDNMSLPMDKLNWWDENIVVTEQQDIEIDFPKYKFKDISKLVERPIEKLPPMVNNSFVQIPTFYTKKERKKIRRQRRREELRETQEKIRLGLIPAPEPKVRLANMMQVLGNEAVIDPTKVEARVREQMDNRLKKHFQANEDRKLTKDERRIKKEKKMKEDTSYGVEVAIYLIKDLNHAATRWKLKENCKQLYMTGVCITTPDHSILVVEGGPKSQRKYKRLLLNRIKWRELQGEDEPDKSTNDTRVVNSKGQELCKFVWSGCRKDCNFKGDMQILKFQTDVAAKDYFERNNVLDYWHLVQSKLLICTQD